MRHRNQPDIRPEWERLFICAFVALSLYGALAPLAHGQSFPQAVDGILDLRNQDFTAGGAISLNGEWRFAWQQLIDPSSGDPFPTSDLFPVPAVWNGMMLGDTRLSGTGYASYQLRLLLPPGAPSLHLALPEINMAHELWVNGQRLSDVGRVGRSAEEEIPQSKPTRVQLPAGESFMITLLVSNHYHMEGGINRVLQIDLSERILRNYELKLLFNFFTLGALFFLGLHYLIIYTYRHREIEHLLYGLLAWVFLLRLVVTNQLTYILFEHPHILSTRISYMTMFLAPTLYVKFLDSLFPQDVSHKLANGMLGIGIIGTLVTFVTPPLFFTQSRDVFTIVTQMLILYAVIAVSLACYRRRQDAAIVLVLVVVFGAAAIHDTLLYQRVISSFDISPFGFLAFMFGHAAILGRRINRALVRETTVSRELAELTESLQRKVDERTNVLADKVALLQSQEKELAKATRAAETANNAKTRFLYAASHDLRQPVHALNLFVEVLNERIVKGSWETIVDKIRLSLTSLNKLLGDLGEVSRLESGLIVPRREALPLHPYFETLVKEFELISARKGLQLKYARTSLWCDSDPEMFDRILRNLLSNAIKYTDTGKILIGCRRCGDEIRIEVRDTGIGIPRESQQVIFEEFHRLNSQRQSESSVGLGLSIVRQLTSLLGHRLSVVSEPGAGSCFALIVPKAMPQSHPVPIESGTSFAAGLVANKKVLCIDDDAVVRASMAELFDAWGASIHCVADQAGAEQVVAEARASGARIDLIITDYLLEHGRTGIDVIKVLTPDLGVDLPPVIVITAENSAAKLQEVASRGYSLLFKPVDISALTNLLQGLLASRQSAGEVP